MRANRGTAITRWLERTLLAIGIVCVGYYGYQTTEARNVQREQIAAFEARLGNVRLAPGVTPSTPGTSSASTAPPARSTPSTPTSTIALLEIPRLKMSSAVMSGDGAAVLDVAIGHLPDTPLPWEPGNSALAAHRDGLFSPLRDIRVGDEVRVRSDHGELIYRVRATKIVAPEDLSVLEPTDTPTLTLITCYPFNFIGNAPKRFIVHADRVDTASHAQ